MTPSTPDAYDALLDAYETYYRLTSAAGVLEWDRYVAMPDEGTPARRAQLDELERAATDRIAGPRFGSRLDALDPSALDPRQRAQVRELRAAHERATRVPDDLRTALAATTDAEAAWRDARATDDFEPFAPELERVVDVKRDIARRLDPDAPPYETLVREYVPRLDAGTVDRVLHRTRTALAPLVERISASDVTLDSTAIHDSYDPADQLAAARDLLDVLGFDWTRGRLDTFDQPFSAGTPADARVCTWTDRSLYQTLWSTAHEGGHALYTQGLPMDAVGTPIGTDRGVVVQEAQASFWERHVFGSEAFWERFLPRLRERFPGLTASPRAVYESVARVRTRNPTWVEADALTAPLHIAVRVDVERELVDGDLPVTAVPAEWRERMASLVGVRPDSLEAGCLQEMQWARGDLGYYPAYTLGDALAAQLRVALERDLGDLDGLIRDGAFDAILDWQREHVHRHGCRYTTPELVERATGEPLTADPLVEHLTATYTDLYDL